MQAHGVTVTLDDHLGARWPLRNDLVRQVNASILADDSELLTAPAFLANPAIPHRHGAPQPRTHLRVVSDDDDGSPEPLIDGVEQVEHCIA